MPTHRYARAEFLFKSIGLTIVLEIFSQCLSHNFGDRNVEAVRSFDVRFNFIVVAYWNRYCSETRFPHTPSPDLRS
jgi:hypothetical protein